MEIVRCAIIVGGMLKLLLLLPLFLQNLCSELMP